MTAFAVLMTLLVIYLAVRLHLFQEQARDLTRQLRNRCAQSNQRLTTFLHDRSVTELCSEVNRCIDVCQESVLSSDRMQKQLKYTIACVSHDIRTPLTGAAGYMQLLEKTNDSEKKAAYCTVIRQKLCDLEALLDELFLYTRLTGGDIVIECRPVQIFPALCDSLAGFYESFLEHQMEPELSFQDEAAEVPADPVQLGRVLRNLISNALSHGCGPLAIRQTPDGLTFSNRVKDPKSVHPEQMFERFYRDDISRRGTHAGLGLSISKELMERMGGTISARKHNDILEITVTFSRQAYNTSSSRNTTAHAAIDT